MPTSARSSTPLFFSRISCASRIRVRSISDADMSCAFCWISTGRSGAREVINAASYACGKTRARPGREPAWIVAESGAGIGRTQKQGGQRAANRCQQYGENHAKKEGDGKPRWREEVVDTGLYVGVGRVESKRLPNFYDTVDVFLLGMESENPNGDQQSVDGEGDYSCRCAETRPDARGEHKSTLATVEIDSQRSG